MLKIGPFQLSQENISGKSLRLSMINVYITRLYWWMIDDSVHWDGIYVLVVFEVISYKNLDLITNHCSFLNIFLFFYSFMWLPIKSRYQRYTYARQSVIPNTKIYKFCIPRLDSPSSSDNGRISMTLLVGDFITTLNRKCDIRNMNLLTSDPMSYKTRIQERVLPYWVVAT